MTDQSTVIASIIAEIKERAALGLIKYGVTLDRTDLSRKDWLVHAKQEAIDLACYLERLIQMEDAADQASR